MSLCLFGVIVLISIICCLLFKQNKKNKERYLSEVDKNKDLEATLDRFRMMQQIKNEARNETERKIAEVDSKSGLDKFNAINEFLSDNN